MKLIKLVGAMSLAFVLTLLVVGMVAAAPAGSGRTAQAQASIALYDDPITPTVTPVLTATLPHTHPVALALSMFFNISYTEVISLQESGIGFGVIARAFIMAKELSGTLTAEEIIALHQAGMGWGQFMKEYGIHPGGKGLGSIMSGHANQNGALPAGSGTLPTGPSGSMGPGSGGNSNHTSGGATSCPGNSCNSPGHNKPGKGPK